MNEARRRPGDRPQLMNDLAVNVSRNDGDIGRAGGGAAGGRGRAAERTPVGGGALADSGRHRFALLG